MSKFFASSDAKQIYKFMYSLYDIKDNVPVPLFL